MKNKNMLMELMGGQVRQREENGFISLTDLQSIYDNQRQLNGWSKKYINRFFENKSEIEYIVELLDLRGFFTNNKKSSFMEHIENQGLMKALKSHGLYETRGRGENKSTFCDVYIFIAIAQWLNPKFRDYVTIWVTDQLILNRMEAGSNYNTLCTAIKEYMFDGLSENGKKYIFSNTAKLINKHVFGRHDDDLRQIASKEQLRKLRDIEIKISTLIEYNVIKSYDDIKVFLSKQ